MVSFAAGYHLLALEYVSIICLLQQNMCLICVIMCVFQPDYH